MWTGHEIVVTGVVPGLTNLFACVFGLVDSAVKVRKISNSTWVVFDENDVADYAIDLTEAGDMSGVYTAAFPGLDEGIYLPVIYKGTKTPGGYQVPNGFKMDWTGTAERDLTTALNVLFADKKYDLELDPEQGKMVLKLAGTSTVIMTKDMKQPDGSPVTRTDQLVAEHVES